MRTIHNFAKREWVQCGDGIWSHVSGISARRVSTWPSKWRTGCGRVFRTFGQIKQWVKENVK
jgi:hypothetical protein